MAGSSWGRSIWKKVSVCSLALGLILCVTAIRSSAAPLSTEPFSLTLAFAGDINFDDDWSVMQYYHANGDILTNVIDPAYLEEMRNADILWLNNEFTYSNRGTPLPGKAYTFRSDPGNVKILHEMGADIVGLANNHVYDYGEDALRDTLATLRATGIPYVGAGYDLAEARSPVYLERNGVRIAYVAASRAEKNKMTPQATDTKPGILRCYDNSLFLESIREASENADFVIALPHWGTEYSTKLENAQLKGAKAYIDAGADAVIGAHTHCIQGIGSYRDKPIVYSLGNFWFNDKSLETMLVELHIKGEIQTGTDSSRKVVITDVTMEIIPGTQSGCVTAPAKNAAEKKKILDHIAAISP